MEKADYDLEDFMKKFINYQKSFEENLNIFAIPFFH